MTTVNAHLKEENYKTVISSSGKEIIADEPKTLGGQDQGFSPSELLASAIASCTAITLRMYADRKKWQIDTINVTVDFIKDYTPNISNFEINIQTEGAIDEAQKQKLLMVAKACPIHKILTHPTNINTQIL